MDRRNKFRPTVSSLIRQRWGGPPCALLARLIPQRIRITPLPPAEALSVVEGKGSRLLSFCAGTFIRPSCHLDLFLVSSRSVSCVIPSEAEGPRIFLDASRRTPNHGSSATRDTRPSAPSSCHFRAKRRIPVPFLPLDLSVRAPAPSSPRPTTGEAERSSSSVG